MSARRCLEWIGLAVAVGCSGSGPGAEPSRACRKPDAFWAASDYSSSAVGALAVSGGASSVIGRVDLGADPVLALSRGRPFVVARDQGTIFELEPTCGTPTSRRVLPRLPHGGSPNPQDVAVAGDGSMWVPLYAEPLLVVLTAGGDVELTMDLSGFDPDGNPNAATIAIVETPLGEKAFVALQRLNDANGFRSEQPSWMLRVDVSTRAVEAHVELAGRNPFEMFQGEGGLLWLAEPGNFDASDEPLAGVERFDTATSTTALVVRETDLGGSVAQIAVSHGCGAAIVADATRNVNATSLVTFDPTTGRVVAPAARAALATQGFDLEGLDWVAGALVLGDRRRVAAGYPVHTLDATSECALVQRPDVVFLPLPPVGLRAVR